MTNAQVFLAFILEMTKFILNHARLYEGAAWLQNTGAEYVISL